MSRLARLLPLALLLALVPARADDDDDDEHEHHERSGHGRADDPRAAARASGSAPGGVAPVTLAAWSSECGSCHMAYPPGLLPARSWETILGDLSRHFGDDAAVAEPTRAALAAYATANAADVSDYRLSRALARAAAGTTPLRVSTIPALLSQHDEIPERWFAEPDVRSRANCVACHPNAAKGSFREGEIRIPGHGGWDD